MKKKLKCLFFLLQTHVTVSKKNTEVIWSALIATPVRARYFHEFLKKKKRRKFPFLSLKEKSRLGNKTDLLFYLRRGTGLLSKVPMTEAAFDMETLKPVNVKVF